MGRPLPPSIANAPDLFDGLEIYWYAYQELSSCRPAGFGGAYPIPFTAVMDYAAYMELDPDQTDDLVYFIRKMDSEFLRWYEEKHGHKPKSGTISKTNAGNREKRRIGSGA